MGLRATLREANTVARQEADERVQSARLRAYRDVLVAVAAVGAAALVAALLLGTVLPGPDLTGRVWLIVLPIVALYVATAVYWGSVRLRHASTPALERANRVRLVLTFPLAGLLGFVLEFATHQELVPAIQVGIAATAAVGLAALLGYWRWSRGR
jgi:hypothetical protein